jgi:hypothetical protein
MKSFHISPLCPVCGMELSGILGSDKLRCFECELDWCLELEDEAV